MDINTVKLQNIPPQQGSLMLSFYNPTHIPPVPTPSLTRATTNVFYISVFWFIFLFVAPGLHRCVQAFSSCGEWGLLFGQVGGLLIAVDSLIAEHRLQARGLQQLWCMGLVAPWHMESPRSMDQTCVLCTGRRILFHCTPREVPCIFVILRML